MTPAAGKLDEALKEIQRDFQDGMESLTRYGHFESVPTAFHSAARRLYELQGTITAAPAPEVGEIERLNKICRDWHKQVIELRNEIERLRSSPSAGAAEMREALEPFAYIGAALEQAGKESWPDGASAKYMALEGLFARDFRHAHAVFSALPTAPTESQSSQAAARASKSDLLRWRGAFRKSRSEDTEEDW